MKPELIKQNIIAEVNVLAADHNASTLIKNVQKLCFDTCITNPGTSVSNSESECVQRCAEKYYQAFEVCYNSLVAQHTIQN